MINLSGLFVILNILQKNYFYKKEVTFIEKTPAVPAFLSLKDSSALLRFPFQLFFL